MDLRRRFADRRDAGRRLAGMLGHLAGERPVVLALPRGGVPVGAEVATALGAPLDVLIVRKLGHPSQPELGLGAVGEDDAIVLNEDLMHASGLSAADLEGAVAAERTEVERRGSLYRRGDRVPVGGRTVIVTDDGLATGYTARAAALIVRARGATKVVLAVGVAPPSSVRDLRADGVVDEMVAALEPARMVAVGEWYADFHQLSDVEVRDILES